MLDHPQHKYRPVQPFARDYAERQWPARRPSAPPIWMSTDLRDGNQALIDPMDAARKLRFFEQLVAVGLKEIEVAFPSASDTDFNFVRKLIERERADLPVLSFQEVADEPHVRVLGTIDLQGAH